jgi:hypothetical protein
MIEIKLTSRNNIILPWGKAQVDLGSTIRLSDKTAPARFCHARFFCLSLRFSQTLKKSETDRRLSKGDDFESEDVFLSPA